VYKLKFTSLKENLNCTFSTASFLCRTSARTLGMNTADYWLCGEQLCRFAEDSVNWNRALKKTSVKQSTMFK